MQARAGVAASAGADVRLGLGLLVLVLLAGAVPALIGVDRWRMVAFAAVRAAVQLAIVAAALRGVFAQPGFVVLVVAVMFGVAVLTAARRLHAHPHAVRAVALACGAGASVAIGVVIGLPTLDRGVRTLVAVSGIVIGATMTVATLTGRRLDSGVQDRRDEIEGWLAIGSTMRQAVRPVAQLAVREALLPGLDQTRTVGLVTLPGAFIGALLGGADAGTAARFQLVVLLALQCAQSITATVLAQLLGAPTVLPLAVTPPGPGGPRLAGERYLRVGERHPVARRSGVAVTERERRRDDAQQDPGEQGQEPDRRRQVR